MSRKTAPACKPTEESQERSEATHETSSTWDLFRLLGAPEGQSSEQEDFAKVVFQSPLVLMWMFVLRFVIVTCLLNCEPVSFQKQ